SFLVQVINACSLVLHYQLYILGRCPIATHHLP
ncbi:hypothetical protein GCK32_022597, partial [Trichostrongylus colubriformis]